MFSFRMIIAKRAIFIVEHSLERISFGVLCMFLNNKHKKAGKFVSLNDVRGKFIHALMIFPPFDIQITSNF